MPAESLYIFDACALIALIEREPGHDRLENLLRDPAVESHIHAINLCEVLYDGLRRRPNASTHTVIANARNAGLHICWNTDIALLARAADCKAHWRRISLADCFALALAETLGSVLLTSDHHEFDSLVAAGATNIDFFR